MDVGSMIWAKMDEIIIKQLCKVLKSSGSGLSLI